MKKNIICLCVVFFIVLIVGQIGKKEFPADLLGNAKNLEDIEGLKFQFDFVDSKKDEKYYKNKKIIKNHMEDKGENDYIAVVTATENVKMRTMSVLQEVVIEKMIKGKGLKEGDKIEIFENSCFYGQSENKHVYIFDCAMNLMQKGNSYLIFFNEYTEDHENKKFYEACGGFFQYLNLTNEDPMYLVQDPKAVYTYGDFKEYEFFSTSEETLKARYELKHKIINRWLDGVE